MFMKWKKTKWTQKQNAVFCVLNGETEAYLDKMKNHTLILLVLSF